MFRTLRADEIELRVGTCTSKGFSLLLYKDARCDQTILDETVGATNWQKSYQLIDGQLFCTIEIWVAGRGHWVGKQDVGTESNTEAEKGRASDAQKRAATVWGIGRELYTAPFIWISGHTLQGNNGKYKTDGFDRELHVSDIGYDDNRNINMLVIKEKNGKAVWTLGQSKSADDKHIVIDEKTALKGDKAVTEHDRPTLVARVSELLEEKKLNTTEVYKKIGVANLGEIETSRLPGMITWLEDM